MGHHDLGISFSLHRCSELGIDKKAVLKGALKDLGFRQFRLMSYWNIHEASRGQYDFSELDWQLDLIAKYGGTVSLAIGKRQPRWPECHIPAWAAALPKTEWYEALYRYIETVVQRYKDHPALESWQLENEALLKEFGYCPDGDYSHARLRHEYALVKQLDPDHPVIMTLSDSWGIPWRQPQPDKFGLSVYRITTNNAGVARSSVFRPGFYRLRARIINILTSRSTFIHELQAEPWGAEAIREMPLDTQFKTMNPALLKQTAAFARRTSLMPAYLWGLEWWYWLKTTQRDSSMWDTAKQL